MRCHVNRGFPSGVRIGVPAFASTKSNSISPTYTIKVVKTVDTAFTTFHLENLLSRGPNNAKNVPQNTNVYKMARTVSRSKICPNRVNSSICVASRGITAKMVVMAELKIETPMKEIDAATRFTRIDAPDMNCIQ